MDGHRQHPSPPGAPAAAMERAGPPRLSLPPAPAPVAPAPTPARQREPILDVLRGFALLGILLINVELMRGADLLRGVGGDALDATAADEVVGFLSGWLAAGKFLSSFSIMFGLGAALIAGKILRAGRSPRPLLARRYAFLLVLGLGHMFLLFPGDILFAYGITGMLLLPFVTLRLRTALRWSAGILAVLLVLGLTFTALIGMAPEPPPDDPATGDLDAFFAEREAATIAAQQGGTYADVIVANAWQVLVIQTATLLLVPWILALFLFGYAVGRTGIIGDVAAHRGRLRRAVAVALPLGLLLNLPTGFLGPMALGAGFQPGLGFSWVVVLSTGAQIIGAPILAVGYLSGVALLCLRVGVPQPLAAVGRMALTAYLLQSVLALVVFAGAGLYDRLGTAAAMLVVLGIWSVLLLVCPLWLRWFRFGPVEWLWRIWTYGARQPLRHG